MMEVPEKFKAKIAELDERLKKLGVSPISDFISDYAGMPVEPNGYCFYRTWDREATNLGFKFRIAGTDKAASEFYEEAYSFDICEFGLARLEHQIEFLEKYPLTTNADI